MRIFAQVCSSQIKYLTVKTKYKTVNICVHIKLLLTSQNMESHMLPI